MEPQQKRLPVKEPVETEEPLTRRPNPASYAAPSTPLGGSQTLTVPCHLHPTIPPWSCHALVHHPVHLKIQKSWFMHLLHQDWTIAMCFSLVCP